MWAPRTDASGCSSSEWPTPTATPYGSNQGGENPGPKRPGLAALAKLQWPTPPAGDAGQSGVGQNRVGGPSLGEAVRTWPTPTCGDAKSAGSRNTPDSEAHAGTSLTDAVRQDGGSGRLVAAPPLNPAWVELLQGFPAGWTDPDPVAPGLPLLMSPSAPGSRRG